MFKNYFVIAFRNLRRNPLYSFINIFGLSIGIACCLILACIVLGIISMNKSLPDGDQIYQLGRIHESINGDYRYTINSTARGDVHKIQANIPELAQGTELNRVSATVLSGEESQLSAIHYTDSNYTKLFPLTLTKGDIGSTLSEPGKVLISQKTADRLFKGQDPVGKTISLNNEVPLLISGVFDPLPELSVLEGVNYLTCYNSISELLGDESSRSTSWTSYYIKLASDLDLDRLEKRASDYIENTNEDAISTANLDPLVKPLSGYLSKDAPGGEFARYLLAFALGLCLIVLMTSCINFINLTTARQSQRSLEVGIRKTSGASRGQLMAQFFSETVVLVVTAFLVAMPLLYALFSWLNYLTDNNLKLGFLVAWESLAVIGVVIAITSLFAGFYPALVLSRFSPIQALKKQSEKMGTGKLRKVLVVIQFSVATILVACCLILHFQILQLKNTDSGVNEDGVMLISSTLHHQNEWPQYRDILINQFQSWPDVVSTSADLSKVYLNIDCEFEGKILKGDQQSGALVPAGAHGNYAKHYQIKLLSGRHLNADLPEDIGKLDTGNKEFLDTPIVLTRTGLNTLGITSPEQAINKKVVCENEQFEMTIVGVADAYPPLFNDNQEFQADAIYLNPDIQGRISLRYQNTTFSDLRERIDEYWSELYPGESLFYVSRKERQEQEFKAMFTSLWSIGGLGVLTIIISLMGLYAMSVFTVERRTKEIGIRKSLGATSSSIVYNLVRDTCKPVFISLLIACPVSYLIGSLAKEYFYQTPPIALITFGMVPFLLLAISVATIYWHSYRAAETNPVKALRYE